jgi:hypothetical protein
MNIYPPIPDTHVLSETLDHNDLAGFIKPWMNKKNKYIRTYKIVLGLGLLFVGFLVGSMLSRWTIDNTMISGISFGVLFSFFLIPIHEIIHGLAFKIKGAKSVQYKAYWKKLVFYAIADKFSVNYNDFRLVALAPFVTITIFCLVLALVFTDYWVFFITVAYSHTAFCGGDFGLLSYMYENRESKILTVDDVDNKKTYFYVNRN